MWDFSTSVDRDPGVRVLFAIGFLDFSKQRFAAQIAGNVEALTEDDL